MKIHKQPLIKLTAIVTAFAGIVSSSSAQSTLTNGLAGYWPMDNITGCSNKTPDIVHGYDLQVRQGGGQLLTNFNTGQIYLTNGFRGNAVYLLNTTAGGNASFLAFQSVNTNDSVPINRKSPTNNTVSFWINTDGNHPPPNADQRIWCESDFIRTYASVFDISANGATYDIFMRQTPPGTGTPYGNMSGGAHISGTLTCCNNGWHNITLVTSTNGALAGTNTAVYYLYVDGVLDPSSGTSSATTPWPNKPDGLWLLDSLAVGALYRNGSAGFLTNCAVDDLAEWARALDTNEIAEYIANGITNTFPPTSPLTLQSFTTDLGIVVQGASVVLSWNVSADGTVTIDNGVGNVTSLGVCGVGSVSVVPQGTTTYTLTLKRGLEPVQTASVLVKTVSNVAAGWNIIDGFDQDNLGNINGQSGWQAAAAFPQVPSAAQMNVTNAVTGNHLLFPDGTGGPGNLGAIGLGSHTLTTGSSNTVFFRFMLDPSINTPDGGGIIPDVDINIGLSDKILRDPNDFQGSDNGPAIRIFRSNFGGGGPINLVSDWGAQSTTGFSWTTSVDPSGLGTGVLYTVWMDCNKTNNDPVLNASSIYSLTMQSNSSAQFTLFSNQIADRSTNAGALSELFICANPTVSPQGTNVVLLDDFYLSTPNYSHTTPVPAGSFVIGTPVASGPITITKITKAGSSATITWTSTPNAPYEIQSRHTLSTGGWTVLANQIPGSGGATTSFVDTTATAGITFYRVVSP